MDVIRFYASHGVMTDPGQHASMLADLPCDISKLCGIVQRNLIHVFWAERFGIKLREDQKHTLGLRKLSEKLSLIRSVDPRPLLEPRDINLRQVGNCRDFTLLMTALLQHQGIPARSRCGFGRYFLPDHFEDHWICEYWNARRERWVMVDSQLDQFQITALGIDFDPLDVPEDQFITGGKAWQMCRSGMADPDQFGIFDMHGWWFIWGDTVRDFLALNKIEILPWDGGWGYLDHRLEDPIPSEPEMLQFDYIARLSANPYLSFSELRTLYEHDPGFHTPGF